MSDPAWSRVCEPEVAISLDTAACCAREARASMSPIDDYYDYVEHVLTLGGEPDLRESDTLGRLLLLGLVSGVEGYFRSTFVGVLALCPISRGHAANHEIQFGAIDYYGADAAALGLFDSSSLASAERIRDLSKKLLGVPVPKEASVFGALQEFDKLCHLRHAAVHARGALGRGNARALGLGPEDGRLSLELRLPTLHGAGQVCHSVVRSFNRFLYRKLVERWIAEGLFAGEWAADRSRYQPLFELFRSGADRAGPSNAYQAYRSLPVSIP